MDITFNKGYSPYKKEQIEKIKILWNIYKSEFGLEGDLFIELKKQNLSESEIMKRIEERRVYVEENIESWHKLGSER